MSKRLIAAFLGAVVTAAIVAGCGGGGSSSSSTAASGGGESSSSPAKAEFIKQADALCSKNNTVMAKEAEKFTPAASAKAGAAEEELVGKVFASGIGRQAEEIRSLAAPSGEAAEVEAIAEAIEAGAKKAEENPSSFGQGAFAEASELARAYGFVVCGGE
jgi:hypothetical protein